MELGNELRQEQTPKTHLHKIEEKNERKHKTKNDDDDDKTKNGRQQH